MRRTLICTLAFSALLLAACAQEAPEPAATRVEPGPPTGFTPPPQISVPDTEPASASDGVLTAAGVSFDIPEGWVAETPSSQMRLAQYSLPGVDGPAEMTVFCFGPDQGGPVQMNIDRWVAQFENPDVPGGQVPSEVTSVQQGGLEVSVVTAQGNYTPTQMGPFAPPQPPVADAALHGVIAAGGSQGTVFVKITGPRTTLEAHADALKAFADSVRLAE